MTREEWEAKQNSLKKDVKYMPTGVLGEVKMVENDNEEPKVDMEKIKKDWNAYLDYLDTKKVRGLPALDKDDLGNKYFREYLKSNPGTSLNESIIPKIREAYLDLRNSQVADIQSGKIAFLGKTGKDADVSGFMKNIVENEKTKNPNYIGQHLTQTRFPGGKIKDKNTGKVIQKTEILTPGKSTEMISKEYL
jgi:hypothetical protein